MSDDDPGIVDDRRASGEDNDHVESCVNCGTTITTTEWHPVVTEADDAGEFQVYAFCDSTCQTEWRDK